MPRETMRGKRATCVPISEDVFCGLEGVLKVVQAFKIIGTGIQKHRIKNLPVIVESDEIWKLLRLISEIAGCSHSP